MMYEKAKIRPCGDSTLLVEIGNVISPQIHKKVRSLFLALEKESIHGINDLLPTYCAILIYYDYRLINFAQIKEKIETLSEHLKELPQEKAKTVEVPTVYGGKYGPDLKAVAQHNSLTLQEVIDIHSNTVYPVYMIGFTPGFPYLGGMSDKIITPRLESPRAFIHAGSVGIAGNQTGIYPQESPGGWRIIGRTPLRLFDAHRQPPCLLNPGDFMQFMPINQDLFINMEQQFQDEQ